MSIGSQELELFEANEHALVRQRFAIAKNLALKKAKGIYRRELAKKAFKRLADAAAKAYAKEHAQAKDWNKLFTVLDRKDFTDSMVRWFEVEYKLGNFDGLLPAKYQKKKIVKAHAEAAYLASNPYEYRMCPVGTRVQTLIFERSLWTARAAGKWAKEHGFAYQPSVKRGAGKVHTTKKSIRIRQLSTSQFRKGSFRTIEFGSDSGIKAVVGCPSIG